jgi:hypothetical protein
MGGRTLLLGGMVLGVVLMSVLFSTNGWEQTWKLWHIPTMPLPFADVRTITGGAESYGMGLDPLVVNPGDPWGRPMNYPRVWQWLHFAGVDSSHSVYFGLGMAALFVLGVLLFPAPDIDGPCTALLLLCIFSPAVLLGIERGNTDLLMFFLLSAAVFSLSTAHGLGRSIALGAMLAAFVLKLYPIFGFAVLLRERRSVCAMLGLLVLVLAGAYAALTFSDLKLILSGTPTGAVWSYGMDVLWLNLEDYSPVLGHMARNLAHVVALLALALAAQGLRGLRRVPAAGQRSLDGFRVGAAVYVGTFLLGSNWDYRLMFLLLTVPQLLSWARAGLGRLSAVAAAVLLGIVVALWQLVIGAGLQSFRSGPLTGLLLDELAHWVLFLGLTYLLAWSSPVWLKALASAPLASRFTARENAP